MSVNTFLISGEVQRIDLNNKPTKKGPAAVILVQYGDSRERTDAAVQFLNIALIRLPPYVYEKCKDQLKLGVWVDVVGHAQGVLKPLVSEGFVTNELVADRLQVADAAEVEDPAQSAAEQSDAA
jgi:hypothetical protein